MRRVSSALIGFGAALSVASVFALGATVPSGAATPLDTAQQSAAADSPSPASWVSDEIAKQGQIQEQPTPPAVYPV
jgi:hypothetical protein